MKKTRNLSGEVFGKLEVLCQDGKDVHGHGLFRCSCECGMEVTVPSYRLLAGKVNSCGCTEEDTFPITPAQKVCPYICCEHNVLFQIFNVDKDPVVTEWVRECGACMCEITPEEEQGGVAGMRRAASQKEIAEIYGVWDTAVQQCEDKALKKLRKGLAEINKDSEYSPFRD